MTLAIWTLPRRWRKPKEPTVNSDDKRDSAQWTREELAHFNQGGERLPITYPRDLDKAPSSSKPESFRKAWHRGEEPAPAKREIPVIREDIRANNRRRAELEAELREVGIRDVELTYELGTALDEVEKLIRDVRKEHKLEPPDVVQPPQAGPPVAGLRDSPDPSCDPAHSAVAAAGAGASGHSEPIHDTDSRFTPLPPQERSDDEIPF